jgi:hypothetical protein
MLANEKRFDDNLKRIGDLYEEAKDCLHNMPIGHYDAGEMKSHDRLFKIIWEMRNMACVNLKANHEIKDN